MSPAVESSDPHRLSRELIERNAKFLEEPIRADYYREMSHMTVLPEHDELLRILRCLHFLSLIIGEAPGKITDEREKLGELLAGTKESIQATHAASTAYQEQLEQRLAELPAALANDIRPEAIAESINESLRQHFLKSGIPETANALGMVSKQIDQAASDFRLKRAVLYEYRWILFSIFGVVLAMGFGLGMACDSWTNRWLQNAQQAVPAVAQPAPAIQKAPVPPVKRAHRRPVPPSAPAEPGSPGSKQ